MASEPGVIDDLDRQLVERLRAQGRETNRTLGADLGVNETTVAARLRRLEAARVLRVVALTDMAGFGYQELGVVMIQVNTRPVMEVARELVPIASIISVSVGTGRFDITCAVLARSREELGRVVCEEIPRIHGVHAVNCVIAVDVLRFDSQWATLRAGEGVDDIAQPTLEHERVDELDLAIVRALQRDARQSNRKIAAELDIAEGTVRVRLKRMEDERLIGIRAICDVESFGLSAAATVGVHVAGGRTAEVAEALMDIDGAAAIIRTLGEFDFVLFVASETRGQMLELVLERIQTLDGVRATETFEAIATLKHAYTWTRLVGPSA